LLKKFQNFKIPKMACIKLAQKANNFSILALKAEAVGVAQISPYGGGGT
jgi:hypothetical protein